MITESGKIRRLGLRKKGCKHNPEEACRRCVRIREAARRYDRAHRFGLTPPRRRQGRPPYYLRKRLAGEFESKHEIKDAPW